MTIAKKKVELLAKPENAADVTLTGTLNSDKNKLTVSVKGTDFAAGKLGTYTYKITLTDSDKKEIVRTFTVNYVDSADTQAYQLSLPTEVDTTVKGDTADVSGYTVTAKVVKTANGATIGDLDASTDSHVRALKYVVKDKDGKDVDSKYVDTTSDADKAVISTVSKSGVGFIKNLSAGTYYVTATFEAEQKNSDGTYSNVWNKVSVSGSFTVKDSQDTAATPNVKANDLKNTSVKAALQNKSVIEITYDGVSQTISPSDVYKVNGTLAGNTAYVTSVEVYVALTDSSKNNKVLITIPVNQSFSNVTSLE